MRLAVLPPPTEGKLRSLLGHEVIRDYPELLPALLALRQDSVELGGIPIGEVFPPGDPRLDLLLNELVWRTESPKGWAPRGEGRSKEDGRFG